MRHSAWVGRKVGEGKLQEGNHCQEAGPGVECVNVAGWGKGLSRHKSQKPSEIQEEACSTVLHAGCVGLNRVCVGASERSWVRGSAVCPGDLAGGGTGHGHLARLGHGYINVPWRRREAAGSSKQRMARAERDCLILSGNTTSYTLLPKLQAWAGTGCSLREAGRRRGSNHRGSPRAKALPATERAHTVLQCWLPRAPGSEPELSPGPLWLGPPVHRARSHTRHHPHS